MLVSCPQNCNITLMLTSSDGEIRNILCNFLNLRNLKYLSFLILPCYNDSTNWEVSCLSKLMILADSDDVNGSKNNECLNNSSCLFFIDEFISCLVVNILSVHTVRYEYICPYMHIYSFYVPSLMKNKGALIRVTKKPLKDVPLYLHSLSLAVGISSKLP